MLMFIYAIISFNLYSANNLIKIQKHNIKRIIVLKDVKIYKKFDIKDFDWLINCSILDKKNSNNFREIYIIIKKCKI